MPRGLLLDFGGVLATNQYDALHGFLAREGLPADAFDPLLASPLFRDLERGDISQPDYERHAAALTGVDPTDLMARIHLDVHPVPSVLGAVAGVRASGVRVGVLSNSCGTTPFNAYAPYDLSANFDAAVLSDQVRMRKPDPEIYRLAAARLGVPPADCVYVDDHAPYLEPARLLGMTTVHATDPATTIAELARLFPAQSTRTGNRW